jgi:hypothetical protein
METTTEKPKRKTHTSTAVKRRYFNKTYTRISADLPKAMAADFKTAVQAKGTSISAVIKKAVSDFIEENSV